MKIFLKLEHQTVRKERKLMQAEEGFTRMAEAYELHRTQQETTQMTRENTIAKKL